MRAAPVSERGGVVRCRVVSKPANQTIVQLRRLVAELDGGGEARLGQEEMATAITEAIEKGRHLVVEAGTGTGKSLAYLVPLVESGRKVVIATATKALQDQLATKDLPFVQAHIGTPFTWAVLKGRNNYLCVQRLREAQSGADGQLELHDASAQTREEVRRLLVWSGETATGDPSELDWQPSVRAWQAVSTTSDECPGATKCPMGSSCLAEEARRRAAVADVIVVNTHLYGTHLASGGVVLPDHDVVVFDEAHQLEDTITDTAGASLGPGRFLNLARLVRQVLADDQLVSELAGAATLLTDVLAPWVDKRLPRPLPPVVVDKLNVIRARVDKAQGELRAIDSDIGDVAQRKLRASRAVIGVINDIDRTLGYAAGMVAWSEGPADRAQLLIAPIDVAPVLHEGVWTVRTAILTSATIPVGLVRRVGLPVDKTTELSVDSPFDYATNGLLYCATHLPDPRNPGFGAAVHDELEALIRAAGGRTLALFTSWKAMDAAVDAMRARLPYTILGQRDLPKPALIEAFRSKPESCLFATAGLFQGIDVPGETLSLVTIDRLPFPRPDDPLLDARRESAGADAFRVVDLPRATTMLAQAAGRLIRSANDRGVVAIFDPRLNKAGYRWDVVKALPPMRRTRHRSEAETFLQTITQTSPYSPTPPTST
jgi:ATP-dependent DNA helicase DinG